MDSTKLRALFMLLVLMGSQIAFAEETAGSSYNGGVAKCIAGSKERQLKKQAYEQLKDLESEGFNVKNIAPIEQSDIKDKITPDLVVDHVSKNEAVPIEVPKEVFYFSDVPYLLNTTYRGAYAFGIIIDDTLRVGRCKDAEFFENNKYVCPVDEGLNYRNSGEGIANDFKVAKKRVSQLLTKIKNDENTQRFIEGDYILNDLGKETQERIREDIVLSGETEDAFNPVAKKRIEEDAIRNHIKTEEFEASLEGNIMKNKRAVIEVYSMFDKYFNTWFTMDMVFSNFGPTLLGRAKELVVKPFYRKNLGGRILEKVGEKTKLSRLAKSLSKEERLLKTAEKLAKSGTRAAQKKFSKEVNKKMIAALERATYLKTKYPKVEKIVSEIGAKKIFTSSGKTAKFFGDIADKIRALSSEEQGALAEIIDLYDRGAKYNMARIKMARAIKANAEEEAKALKQAGKSKEAFWIEEEAKAQYLAEEIKSLKAWDDMMNFDMPEYIMWQSESTLQKYAFQKITPEGTPPIRKSMDSAWYLRNKKGFVQSYADAVDKATKQGYTGKELVEKANEYFAQTLRKRGFDAGYVERNGVKYYGIKMYEPASFGVIGEFPNSELTKMASGRANVAYLDMSTGEQKFLTKNVAEELAKADPNGTTKLYAVGFKDEPDFVLDSEQMIKRYLEERLESRQDKIAENLAKLKKVLIEEGSFGRNRNTLNLMDEVFKKKIGSLTEMYVSPKSSLLAWNLGSLAYWQGRKGFNDVFGGTIMPSAIMLPETWGSFHTSYKDDDIYRDAYIDFFANHGSDDGDMMVRALNSLMFGYKYLVNQFGEYTKKQGLVIPFLENTKVNKGRRTSTQDLVIFSNTDGVSCPNCYISVKPEGEIKKESYVDIFLKSTKKIKTKILENSRTDDKESGGSVLIAFAHHLDLESEKRSQKIDLTEAIEKKESCAQKAKVLGIDMDSEIGAAIGIAENLAYMLNFGFGIMASVSDQIFIASNLQDCVDTREGYFIYMFSPFKIDESQNKKAEEMKEKKTMVAYSVIKDIDNLVGETKGSTAIDSFKEQVKQTTKAIAYNMMINTIIQASVDAKGETFGKYSSNKLTMFWFSGNSKANPNRYDTETKLKLEGDENKSIVIDKEKDIIKIGDKQIDAGKDIARTSYLDPESQSYIIPARLGAIKLDGSDTIIFKINKHGELEIQSEEVRDCLNKIVEEQTGLGVEGKDLSLVFGKVLGFDTEYYNISINGVKGTITANGTPRITITGKKAEVEIKANAETILKGDKETAGAGILDSIQFEHGTMIYNRETKELIVHLNHHRTAVLNQSDVQGLKMEAASVEGENGCPEPAINLEAIANQDDEMAKQKVKNFNISIKKMGPFQILETEDKIYMFYSDRDETGECQDYFKIIDKKTGKTLYEGKIKGKVKSENGKIKFETEDGKKHTISPEVHNGVPTITYNNGPKETLLKAKGPNGSFWYNPETGMWYPENAYMVPLDSSYRQGFLTQKENGKITTTATGNVLNVNLGPNAANPLNLPSVPEKDTFIYLVLILLSIVLIYSERVKKRG